MTSLVLLMKSLVDKDLRVRYKRSLLGFLWFLLKPLFSMAVYTVVFTRIIRFGGAIQHFSLFLLAGFFRGISSALPCPPPPDPLDNHRLIRSVYFPRAALPVAAVLANGVHMILALGVLEALLWIWGHPPGPPLLALIPGALMLCCLTPGWPWP